MNKARFSAVPQYIFRELTDITPDFLELTGIKFLMVDLDNTVAAYDEHLPSDSVMQWFATMKSREIALFILSNTTCTKRVEAFSKALDTECIKKSGKPSARSLLKAMNKSGFSADESALAGDQVFTDALAANRAGVVSIIVRPKRFTNPFLTLRYYIELPVRAMCKHRDQKLGVSDRD
jgi:hypothetical protein